MLGVGREGPLGPSLVLATDVETAVEPRSGGDGGVAERDAWVALACTPGVGPLTFERLVDRLGGACAVLDRSLSPDGAEVLTFASAAEPEARPSLSPDAFAAIQATARDPSPVLRRARSLGLQAITLDDPRYPVRLRAIDLPPPVLFIRGELDALEPADAVAIVGTRRPTEAGRRTAARIATAVAELGATIVSGLALGIDGAAHAAAVAADRPTVAVIGGGHARLYPRIHERLADRIVAGGGAIVSEFAPDTEPTRGTFPRRNRLISGLSDSTVVVEAGARSGALTTAAWALEQGRRLFLVPGPIDTPTVAGCLAFLRELAPEARIVAGIAELLEDLELVATARRRPSRATSAEGRARARRVRLAGPDAHLAELGTIERRVMSAILAGNVRTDPLVASTGLPLGAVLGAITALELRGFVANAFGQFQPLGVFAGLPPEPGTGR